VEKTPTFEAILAMMANHNLNLSQSRCAFSSVKAFKP
jgi:hypothetical protein